MILNRALYAMMIGMWAFSPVLSLYLLEMVGSPLRDYDWLTFMWVSAGLSLPCALAAARLAGRERYRAYWDYLETKSGPWRPFGLAPPEVPKSSSGNSKRGIIVPWAIGTGVLAAMGLASLFT